MAYGVTRDSVFVALATSADVGQSRAGNEERAIIGGRTLEYSRPVSIIQRDWNGSADRRQCGRIYARTTAEGQLYTSNWTSANNHDVTVEMAQLEVRVKYCAFSTCSSCWQHTPLIIEPCL